MESMRMACKQDWLDNRHERKEGCEHVMIYNSGLSGMILWGNC